MVFKSFKFWVLIRILAAMGLMAAFFALVQADNFQVTAWFCMVLSVLVIVELLVFVGRYNRQLLTLVESLANSDFNLSFASSFSGKFPAEFAGLLTDIAIRFRNMKIEEERKFQMLQQIVDDISFAILCFDSEGKVVLHNDAAQSMLGFRGCINLVGIEKIYPSLYGAINQPNLRSKVIQIIVNNQIYRLSYTCKKFLLFGSEYRLVTLSDIQPLVDEQEQESWKKVIRVLTHEIVNSVAPIVSLCQSFTSMANSKSGEVNGRDPVDTNVHELLEGYRIIGERSTALARFVDQFRRLTKIPEPMKESVSVSELLMNVARLTEERLSAEHVALKMSSPELTCMFDKGQIVQVLLNLVYNAVDALAGKKENKVIDVSAVASQEQVCIVVRDNGVGISEVNLDKVFVPFFTTKHGGSGIGLSIAREVMRQHGGNISIRSKEGEGTEVILCFSECS